jgi:hypothetical protein
MTMGIRCHQGSMSSGFVGDLRLMWMKSRGYVNELRDSSRLTRRRFVCTGPRRCFEKELGIRLNGYISIILLSNEILGESLVAYKRDLQGGSNRCRVLRGPHIQFLSTFFNGFVSSRISLMCKNQNHSSIYLRCLSTDVVGRRCSLGACFWVLLMYYRVWLYLRLGQIVHGTVIAEIASNPTNHRPISNHRSLSAGPCGLLVGIGTGGEEK